jgi:hypothetical protein
LRGYAWYLVDLRGSHLAIAVTIAVVGEVGAVDGDSGLGSGGGGGFIGGFLTLAETDGRTSGLLGRDCGSHFNRIARVKIEF